MKMLITGGLGFIGSAVTRLAILRGHTVINLDAITYSACKKNLESINKNPNYFFEKADITEKEKLNYIFDKYRPEKVIHLAAETHVDRSIYRPEEFIETNIKGTFNMLEVSLNYWKKRGRPDWFKFHHVSTDEVYGSLSMNSKDIFTENSSYKPRSPYSASKASSDHLVRSWYETYGLPTIISNCSNNYGPYQFPEKFVPVVILNAISNKPIPIYGDGHNIRDWLYVEDHALALLLILEKGSIGKSYNIGGGNQYTNLELTKLICKLLNNISPANNKNYMELITFVTDRPGHDLRYALDSKLIKKELGWKPKIDLKEGIEKTVKWYLENKKWWVPLLNKS